MYESTNSYVILKLISRDRDCAHCKKVTEGEHVNIAHTGYFLLNDDFEHMLDTLGDNKETENEFEEVS